MAGRPTAVATWMCEGMDPKEYIDASIKEAPYDRKEWFKRFNSAYPDLKVKDDGTYGDGFKEWLDKEYAKYKTGDDDGYGTEKKGLYHDMLVLGKKVHLLDTGYQYRTPITYVDSRGERKHLDLTKGHYLARHMEKGKDKIYRARDGGRYGDLYRIWDDYGHESYGILAEGSPGSLDGHYGDDARVEVTTPVLNDVGMAKQGRGVARLISPDKALDAEEYTRLQCERLGPSGWRPGMPPLDDEEILERGRKLDAKRLGNPPVKTEQGGLFRLKTGEVTLPTGPEHRALGIVDPSCQHDGGGHISDSEGSKTVFAGIKLSLVAGVGDPTSDGYEVKTGLDNLIVY